MKSNNSSQQTTYLIIGALALAAGIAVYLSLPKKKSKDDNDKPSSSNSGITPTKSNVNRSSPASSSTAATSTSDDDKNLHRQIEEIDREGKALYKDKRYTEAAACFTKALDLIDINNASSSNSSLTRQIITLTNNRSAMYEKASLPDLALSDCDIVLQHDPSHVKARSRRLRILESLNRHSEALVEVCALQLKYMAENRDKIRLGLPPSQPAPVSQGKIEELVVASLPEEMERVKRLQEEKRKTGDNSTVQLPSTYTIVQLLKSFSGYNKWMGEAAKGGMVDVFSLKLEELENNAEESAENIAKKCLLLYQRGRRYAFEKKFDDAVSDFDGAYHLVCNAGSSSTTDEKKKEMIVKAMGINEYCRLLEWEGMCRHLRYDLKGALECYQECSELEPENVGHFCSCICCTYD
jgi:tetratricopeptide (TPR) repeat protein